MVPPDNPDLATPQVVENALNGNTVPGLFLVTLSEGDVLYIPKGVFVQASLNKAKIFFFLEWYHFIHNVSTSYCVPFWPSYTYSNDNAKYFGYDFDHFCEVVPRKFDVNLEESAFLPPHLLEMVLSYLLHTQKEI